MKINPQSRRRTESFPSLCNLVQLCTFLAQVLNHVLNFTASVLNTHAHGPSSGESPTHKQGSMWNPFKLTSYLQCLWDFCCQVKNAPVEAQHFCQEKLHLFRLMLGFPGRSHGKESACSAGDLGSIPGSEKSPREEHGNPLQYSFLESSIDRGAWRATVHGVTKSQHD